MRGPNTVPEEQLTLKWRAVKANKKTHKENLKPVGLWATLGREMGQPGPCKGLRGGPSLGLKALEGSSQGMGPGPRLFK